MNLYKYYSSPDRLIGYDKQLSVPTIAFKQVANTDYWRGPTEAKMAVAVIHKYQSVLGKDPNIAYRSAKIYQNCTTKQGVSDQLWPRRGAAEQIIATDPESIADYTSDVLGVVTPEYFDQILKATPETLNEYLARFEFKDMVKKYPDFVKKAFARISTDPNHAFYQAVTGGKRWERIPELEDAIYNWNPDRQEWLEQAEEEFMDLPDIDWDEESPSVKLKDYPHFDSPWNLYLAQLQSLSARLQLIKERGFKGREFR